MNFAETAYVNHLLAQEMVDIVRSAIIQQQSIDTHTASFANANDIYAFGIWVFGAITHEFTTDDMPQLQIEYAGQAIGGSTIIVIVSDSYGNISGRGIGRVWT